MLPERREARRTARARRGRRSGARAPGIGIGRQPDKTAVWTGGRDAGNGKLVRGFQEELNQARGRTSGGAQASDLVLAGGRHLPLFSSQP